MFIPLHDQNALKTIKLQFVTLALIAINVVVWLMTASLQAGNAVEANSMFYSFGFIPAVVRDVSELPVELVVIPETASYLTYAFLHGDFMHLAGNMLFLWVFGDNVEDAMGHFRFLIFYLLCAVAGALAHGFIDPNSQVPLVGASGAAAGLVGAYLILHPKVKVWILALGRIPLRLSAFWVLGGWIGFQIFSFVTMPESNVSWAAHIGGFAAGAALIFVFRRLDVALFDADIPGKTMASVHEEQETPPSNRSNPAENIRRWGRGE